MGLYKFDSVGLRMGDDPLSTITYWKLFLEVIGDGLRRDVCIDYIHRVGDSNFGFIVKCFIKRYEK